MILVIDDTGRYRTTYQEHNRYIEQEGDKGVEEEDKEANAVDVSKSQARQLSEEQNKAVHNSTGRCIVVQRNKGVHLELIRAENALDHDKTNGFEDDTANLEQDAGQYELDLAKRGDDNTKDDEGNVSEGLEVYRADSETPAGKEDSNRSGGLRGVNAYSNVGDRCIWKYLEHLNEGHAEIQIRLITTD